MSQILRPASTITQDDWSDGTIVGFWQDLSDGNDVSYSFTDYVGSEGILGLSSGSSPGAGTKTLTVRCLDASGTEALGAITVKLYEGAVLRQTFSSAANLGAIADHNFTVTASITNYTALRVGILPDGTWVDPTQLHVAEISFTIPDAAMSAPTLVSATVTGNGRSLVLVWSEAVNISVGELALSPSSATADTQAGSGDGTTTITCTLSKPVPRGTGQTITVDAGVVLSLSSSTANAAIVAAAVLNHSAFTDHRTNRTGRGQRW